MGKTLESICLILLCWAWVKVRTLLKAFVVRLCDCLSAGLRKTTPQISMEFVARMGQGPRKNPSNLRAHPGIFYQFL